MQRERDIGDERRDFLGMRQLLIESLLKIHRRQAEIVLQDEVVKIEHLTELGGEAVTLEQIRHTHRSTGHLVLVRRTDAAPGGADGVRSARSLACAIQLHMRGQNQRTVGRDPQPLEHRDALADQRRALDEQCIERQHDAVADETAHLLAQDARGNQGKYGLAAADDESVAGVVSALKARDGGDALGQQIDDLALALIAPLRADDDDELAHRRPLADQKENHHSDQHAAESGDAQLTISGIEQPGERALHTARVQEWSDALEDEEQRQRRQQIGEIQRHAMLPGARSALAGCGILQVLEEFTIGSDDQQVPVLAE